MAINSKNKYPADKGGTKYSEFRNTKRVSAGKVLTDKESKKPGGGDQAAGKTA